MVAADHVALRLRLDESVCRWCICIMPGPSCPAAPTSGQATPTLVQHAPFLAQLDHWS